MLHYGEGVNIVRECHDDSGNKEDQEYAPPFFSDLSEIAILNSAVEYSGCENRQEYEGDAAAQGVISRENENEISRQSAESDYKRGEYYSYITLFA